MLRGKQTDYDKVAEIVKYYQEEGKDSQKTIKKYAVEFGFPFERKLFACRTQLYTWIRKFENNQLCDLRNSPKIGSLIDNELKDIVVAKMENSQVYIPLTDSLVTQALMKLLIRRKRINEFSMTSFDSNWVRRFIKRHQLESIKPLVNCTMIKAAECLSTITNSTPDIRMKRKYEFLSRDLLVEEGPPPIDHHENKLRIRDDVNTEEVLDSTQSTLDHVDEVINQIIVSGSLTPPTLTSAFDAQSPCFDAPPTEITEKSPCFIVSPEEKNEDGGSECNDEFNDVCESGNSEVATIYSVDQVTQQGTMEDGSRGEEGGDVLSQTPFNAAQSTGITGKLPCFVVSPEKKDGVGDNDENNEDGGSECNDEFNDVCESGNSEVATIYSVDQVTQQGTMEDGSRGEEGGDVLSQTPSYFVPTLLHALDTRWLKRTLVVSNWTWAGAVMFSPGMEKEEHLTCFGKRKFNNCDTLREYIKSIELGKDNKRKQLRLLLQQWQHNIPLICMNKNITLAEPSPTTITSSASPPKKKRGRPPKQNSV